MGRHPGLLVNGASIVPGGRSGNALRLNAAGKQCVSLGDVLPMTNQSFSISGWIRVQNGDLTQAAAMFSRHNPGVGTGYFVTVNSMFGFGQNGRAVMFAGSEIDPLNSQTIVNNDQWHHVVGVYQLGGEKRLYVNGSPAQAAGVAQPITFANAITVIGGVSVNRNPEGYFNGLIDDVQVYGFALTDGQVDFLHANPGMTLGTVTAPVIFLPPAGRFTNQVLVQLTSTVVGAEVRYTLDGTTPTVASPRYEGPLALTGRTRVTARAFLQGFAVGDAVSALYERVYAHAGDGIPDAWRQHYFGPDFALRPEAAPGADPDGDGLDNFREFLAGTNPLDPASGVVLGIRAVPELRWQGVSNLLYRVLRRDLAGPGAWQVIGTVQGTNGVATFLDLEARLPESYYALEVVR